MGAPDVVVIGHDLWTARFGSDSGIVGRQVAISGVPHTVVGVMPEGFRFPHWQQLWLPLPQGPTSGPDEGAPLWIFGRLADGGTEAEANVQVGTAGREPRVLSWFMPVDWYLDLVVQSGLAALVVVLVSLAVFSLYAIMSFGVSERAREIGIRAALGAGREDIALSVGKRALWQIGFGVILGTPGVIWLFFSLREYARIELPARVMVVGALVPGLVVLVLVALLACTSPTLRALRIDPNEVLKAEG